MDNYFLKIWSTHIHNPAQFHHQLAGTDAQPTTNSINSINAIKAVWLSLFPSPSSRL